MRVMEKLNPVIQSLTLECFEVLLKSIFKQTKQPLLFKEIKEVVFFKKIFTKYFSYVTLSGAKGVIDSGGHDALFP